MCMNRVHGACRVRLLSLASQRFIATALHDAMQIQARRLKQPAAQLKGAGHDIKDKRSTLTLEDLAQALQEVDIITQVSPSSVLCLHSFFSSTCAHMWSVQLMSVASALMSAMLSN